MYHLEKKDQWIYTDRELDMKVTVPPGWKAVKLETPRLPALQDKEDVKNALQSMKDKGEHYPEKLWK